MSTTFTGWMGYGTALTNNILSEPTDAGYARHPFALGDLDHGFVSNSLGGTAGPAIANWGTLSYAAVFDAAAGGNLLFWMPLERLVSVPSSGTMTLARQALRFLFPDLRNGVALQSWPAGAVIATVNIHRSVRAGVALQFAGGTLAASSPVLGSTVTLANLPSSQPAAGSGLLWNNGGIVSIA